MTTMNISLPDDLKEFVDEQMQAGYSSASEYIRELIRTAQKQAAREKLQAMLLDGINSGPSMPFTEEDWKAIRKAAQERRARQAGGEQSE